ncbi:hypothetical protein AMATHDRAFT_54020 [Amanita thiersii Skay4041]|uniref:Uncharacterized protein n=1 Tax=Amanita thiersii Skay4041 TaxID=703135 RepID=A0A2A9NZS4_9AGAR|nr:hypothetical protein AMATHDRAFT_54020 [Amanita thiersii Skay4041]
MAQPQSTTKLKDTRFYMEPELSPDSLYAVLLYEGDPRSWNWALFIPDPFVSPIGSSGTVFRVFQVCDEYDVDDSRHWKFEDCHIDVISSSVVAIIQLIDINGFTPDLAGEILLEINPYQATHADDFSSRVWFLSVMKALHIHGLLPCDVDVLERDICNCASDAMNDYLDNKGWTVFTAHSSRLRLWAVSAP